MMMMADTRSYCILNILNLKLLFHQTAQIRSVRLQRLPYGALGVFSPDRNFLELK